MSDFWPIPVLWPGATVVVLAGGPSLDLRAVRHVGIARLEERCRVICVNDAAAVAWWADWLHAADHKWWNQHRLWATKFPGVKTTMIEGCPPAWGVRLLRNQSAETPDDMGGFAGEPDALCSGGNGGYQAIQIAAVAGGKRVLLLGIDMRRSTRGERHWFGDHWDGAGPDYATDMLPWFETLVAPLRERGVEVVNCSAVSAIECFPRARLEEVL